MTTEKLRELQEIWREGCNEFNRLDFDEEYESYLNLLGDLDLPDLLLDYVSVKDIDANIKGLIFIQAFYDVVYDLGLYTQCNVTLDITDSALVYIRNYNLVYKKFYSNIYCTLDI